MTRGLVLTHLVFLCAFSVSLGQTSLSDYLSKINSETEYEVFFEESWIESIVIDDTSSTFPDNVRELISGEGLKLYIHKEKYVFIYPNRIELARTSIAANTSLSSSSFLRVGDPAISDPNKEYVLSGRISDRDNASLLGVNILIDDALAGRTDNDGYYELNLVPGNYRLEYRFIGLETEKRLLTLYSSGEVNLSMFESTSVLDEIVVEADQLNSAFANTTGGVQKIGIEKLEKLPSFLGNVDVLKSATALPGVTVSGESSSYLNVRGGRNDQTMVLMNGATIYNPGHLLGFFSVFNGDFVSDLTLYKGNIPAKFGMRSSSVLDVKMNKWAKKKVNVYGGLGIADSNLGVKMKLLDEKLDVHVGGRISYVDWIFNLVPEQEFQQSSAQFGDVNLSSRFSIDDKNKLYLSSYYGEDVFEYNAAVNYNWSNRNMSLRWTSLLNDSWVVDTEVTDSELKNTSENLGFSQEFELSNGIRELGLKSVFSSDDFELGYDVAYFDIDRERITPTEPSSRINAQEIDDEALLNLGLHASYFWNVSDRIMINPGVRVNHFQNLGPGTVNLYEENAPYQPGNVIGEEIIESGEAASTTTVLEPRLGINYEVDDHLFRIGYSRINQFLHLISNTFLINPVTLWKGADRYIPRTVIDQYSIGYKYQIDRSKGFSIGIDGFYKRMDNLLEYRDAASFLLNPSLEQEILEGDGLSYGFEFLLSKDQGKLSGLASYTFSRAFVTVNDRRQGVVINDGERYPYYSDRPHNIKASLDYKLTRKWTISSNFTYISGSPVNAPIAYYQIEGETVPLFSERNSQRMPDYHRLDLVITVKSRIRKSKRNQDRWVLTLYNVYSRANVANIFFAASDGLPTQPFQLVNIDQVIPTITYKFEF